MDIVDKLESIAIDLNSFSRRQSLRKASKELQTLRAKVASADVLVEALRKVCELSGSPLEREYDLIWECATKALTTYDKLSEVKHDTK